MVFRKCATCGKAFSGVCFTKGHQIGGRMDVTNDEYKRVVNLRSLGLSAKDTKKVVFGK